MATKLKAIDVSYAQGDMDFKKVADAGIDAVIIRSSFGWKADSQKDQYFNKNIAGFKSNGISCGVYHYSYATTVEEAKLEAEFCLKCIGSNSLELPIYYDIEEGSQAALGKTALTNIAVTFCEEIKKAGHNTGVYSSLNFFNNYLDYDKINKNYSVWLAQWNVTNQLECDIWQYSSTGKVDGIKTNVDMNWCFIDPLPSDQATVTNPNENISGTESDDNTSSDTDFSVGEVVYFKGGHHYVSSDAINPAGNPKAGNAKITIISINQKHPYHIIHTDSSSAVYGWVDKSSISKISSSGGSSSSNSMKAGQKITLKNVSLYVSSTAQTRANTVSGTYYLWDTEVINSRIRITNSLSNVGNPEQVTGWIDKTQV